jgi:hypothetical protein
MPRFVLWSCRRGFTNAAMIPTLCSTRTFYVKLSPNEPSGLRAYSPLRKHAGEEGEDRGCKRRGKEGAGAAFGS